MVQRIAAAWFGGAVGALVNSLALWLLARADVLAAIGVRIAPTLSGEWLADRLVWGSLWALGYPALTGAGLGPVRAGLALSLAPSAAQLLYFFPRAGHGALGVSLGAATPLVVLAANGLWGWVLARSVVAARGR
jgi:hypothetical protein